MGLWISRNPISVPYARPRRWPLQYNGLARGNGSLRTLAHGWLSRLHPPSAQLLSCRRRVMSCVLGMQRGHNGPELSTDLVGDLHTEVLLTKLWTRKTTAICSVDRLGWRKENFFRGNLGREKENRTHEDEQFELTHRTLYFGASCGWI